MPEQQKQSPEPEFEGTLEDFLELLKNKNQTLETHKILSHFKVLGYPEKGKHPEIRIDDFAEYLSEKQIDEIIQTLTGGVIFVDTRKGPKEGSYQDVITTMVQGAKPLAEAGIIDVLTVNIDERPEGSLKEPIDIRKTRISGAFTGILGSATVGGKEQKSVAGEVQMAKERTPKERSDILENNVKEIRETLDSFQGRFNQFASNMESRVGNVDGKIGKVENDISRIDREHGQKLDELSSGINKLLKHAGLDN